RQDDQDRQDDSHPITRVLATTFNLREAQLQAHLDWVEKVKSLGHILKRARTSLRNGARPDLATLSDLAEKMDVDPDVVYEALLRLPGRKERRVTHRLKACVDEVMNERGVNWSGPRDGHISLGT